MKQRKRRTGYWKKIVSGMLCAAMLCTTLGIPASGHTTAKEKAVEDCAAETHIHSETCENKKTLRTAAEEAEAEEERKPEAEKKEEKKPETEKQTEKAPETEKQTEKAPETEKQTEKAPETEKQTEKAPETEKQTEKAPEAEKQTEKAPETEKQTEKAPETEKQTEKTPETEQTPETETGETEIGETESETESETGETEKKEDKNKKKRASEPPIQIEDFVVAGDAESGKKTQLRYRISNEEAWKELGSEPIPGNAHIRLDVLFGRVPLDDLIAAGGKLVYQLPEIMRDPVVSGEITAGTHAVGVIEVEDKTVTLTFHQDYLDQMEDGGADRLGGQFYVESWLDLSYIEEAKPGELVVGDVYIKLDFDEDLIAKYGRVEIEKSIAETRIEETEEGAFLTYTLKVTAGQDGCKAIKVHDTFIEHKQYIAEYVGVTGEKRAIVGVQGVTENGAPAGKGGFVFLGTLEKDAQGRMTSVTPAGAEAVKPGELIWEIGDMAKREERTLTYKVKLKPEYTGGMLQEAERRLRNSADVYSDKYPRDDALCEYTSIVHVNETKKSFEPVKNEDGSYSIRFGVWFKAQPDNTVTLRNVKITDRLDDSDAPHATANKFLPWVEYEQDSFELHVRDENGRIVPTPPAFEAGVSNPQMNPNKRGFTYYVGDMEPNEEYMLLYKVKVKPQAFALAGNGDFWIRNKALLRTDSGAANPWGFLAQAWADRKMSHKQWDRKMVGGTPTEADLTIPFSGEVYEFAGNAIQAASGAESSFVVPAGSYQYHVIANEDGDWNLSSASMKDALGNDHMEFAGYVRVDAYRVEASEQIGSGKTDSEAVTELKKKPLIKTVWVKIDGRNGFAFKPEQIGLNGTSAYLLTYYARPVNMDGQTQVAVSNEFAVSGTVGWGDWTYDLAGIKVGASVIVSGENSFAAEKEAWYYDKKECDGNYTNGSLYWAVRIDGKRLLAGMTIKDITPNQNNGASKMHELYEDSVRGVYRGKPEGGVAQYETYQEALDSGTLTEIDTAAYETVIQREKRELDITIKEDIELEDKESVWVILRTNPSELPTDKRGVFEFKNTLKYQDGAQNWVEVNTASQNIFGSKNIMKEINRFFTYDGEHIKDMDDTNIKKDVMMWKADHKPGTYVAWTVKLNYRGNLDGKYTVTDIVPEGMEVVYARIKWIGNGYGKDGKTLPQVVRRTEAGEWTEDSITANTDGNRMLTSWYYKNGQEVCWDVENLYRGQEPDTYAVDFQILCRVTDPDVIRGGEEKVFNNQVVLTSEMGKEVGNDSDSIRVKKETLSKVGVYDETNGGVYPFELTINELGEDMVQGSDKVTLVDTMSDSLTLDVDSISVEHAKTHETIENYRVSVNGQTMKIELPDDVPLKVRYSARVHARPGEAISISNAAHWEGYAAPSSGVVSDSDFSYGTSAEVEASGHPTVKVTKMDQNDISLKLAGAKFALAQCEDRDGVFVPKKESEAPDAAVIEEIGVTGEGGTLVFTEIRGTKLEWNTVYLLRETEAPQGYVLDEKPHYFAVAKKNRDETYPEILEEYKARGVLVYYLDAEYDYQAYNHKGEAEITKKFEDKEKEGDERTKGLKGTYTFGIFEVQDGVEAEEALQTVTIKFTGKETEQEKTAKFEELDAGKTYVIYELDDQGEKIKQDEKATVSGMLFEVSYEEKNAVNIPEIEEEMPKVTVTNAVAYVELPELGGPGTRGIYGMAFLLLMFAGSGLYLMGCRRKDFGKYAA